MTSEFAGSVHPPLNVFLVTDTRAVADSLGEPQPLRVGLGILFPWENTRENKRASAGVGYCLRFSFLGASLAFVVLLEPVACS